MLELVEGPTLADRISKGPIPLDEALPIAKQIAEALEAAHEAGVIHRDLKPANIKVRDDGTVKVLDFGLAKALDPNPKDDPSQSPTLTAAATQMGVIMGTAAYMSPEQAKGKIVDKRADVWALGAVLYEMLTGQKPFVGVDVADTLATVLKFDPDWDLLPADVPSSVRRLLRRCLVKDANSRWRDAGSAIVEIREAEASPERDHAIELPRSALRFWQRPMPVALTLLVAVLVTGGSLWMLTRPAGRPAEVVRFSISPSEVLSALSPTRDLAISADGTQIVYSALLGTDSVQELALRPIDRFVGEPLLVGESVSGPFFSPGGDWVGSMELAGRILYKTSTQGGLSLAVTESTNPIRGATWGRDDRIVFGTIGDGLFRVSSGGGDLEALTTVDRERGDTGHVHPAFIGDHGAIVFVIQSGDTSQLGVLDLDSGDVTRLDVQGFSPRYVSTGHLVYATAEGALVASTFDAASLQLTGSPVPLVEGVMVEPRGAANFSVSDEGRLVYVPDLGGDQNPTTLVWVDRAGEAEPLDVPVREYGAYGTPRISPDGMRVALDNFSGGSSDIWVWDFAGKTMTRLTFAPEADIYPHWTPDGQHIVFSSQRGGRFNLFRTAANGTGSPESLADADVEQLVNAVTPDGKSAIAHALVPERSADLIVVSLTGDPQTESLISTEFAERDAALSPDGKWVAFESNMSGQTEVYVRPFPDVEAGQWQVSTSGGRDPAWAPDGSEVFYKQGDGMMAVSVQTEPAFGHFPPTLLFRGNYQADTLNRDYDVASDGRFLMIGQTGQAEGGGTQPQINVVLNWFEELKERVPVP